MVNFNREKQGLEVERLIGLSREYDTHRYDRIEGLCEGRHGGKYTWLRNMGRDYNFTIEDSRRILESFGVQLKSLD